MKELTFSDYQSKAPETAKYIDSMYPIMSLMIEAGELADEFAKPLLRGDYEEPRRDKIVKEAGDVLWMLTMILCQEGISLEEVAYQNLDKLQRRAANGTIHGRGER